MLAWLRKDFTMRSVVAEGFHHADGTFDDRLLPIGPLRRIVGRLVAEGVRLKVRLRNEIEAVFVAEVVEARIVRVVRRADGVDVVLLHDENVFDHVVVADGAAVVRIDFMAVDAANHDGDAVDEQVAVLDFDGAETDALRKRLDDSAFCVNQRNEQRVEIRRFRRPMLRRFDGAGEIACAGIL